MTYAQIDARLKELGWEYDAMGEAFRRNGRLLLWERVLRNFPNASEDLLCSYAEDRMRQAWGARLRAERPRS